MLGFFSLSTACRIKEADIVFLTDGSKSISPGNFSIMKTFMKKIVDSFPIDKDKVQIGVVQYSKEPQKEFYLNEFYNSVEIKQKIDNIIQLNKTTNTGKGLSFVKSFFEPANGGRRTPEVLQALIVMTDGKSNDAVNEAAIALRNYGIQIFVIGIGIRNSFELLRIAGKAHHVYEVKNFKELEKNRRKIINEICDSEDRPRQGNSQQYCMVFIFIDILYHRNELLCT